MADCASLLDEELSSFVFNYLTENSGSQYGEEEVCSDFPDFDLSQLDASDFCLSELHWCSDHSPASTQYSAEDPELFEEENAALLAALTDSLDGIVEDAVRGLSVFSSLGEDPEEEEEEEEADLPLDSAPLTGSLSPETEDPSLLKQLLMSPPNVPVGFEMQGSAHRNSSRGVHVRLAKPVLRKTSTHKRRPRPARPAGHVCTELHRHLTTGQEDEDTPSADEEEDDAEEDSDSESSNSEGESTACIEPPKPQFSSDKELHSVVELIRYMHTYCMPTRKQASLDRKEREASARKVRAENAHISRSLPQNCYKPTPQTCSTSGSRPRVPFSRRRELKPHSLLKELLETVSAFDVSKPYRIHSSPYSHSRVTTTQPSTELYSIPARQSKAQHKDCESLQMGAKRPKSPEPEKGSFSVRRSRRLASFPSRFARRSRVSCESSTGQSSEEEPLIKHPSEAPSDSSQKTQNSCCIDENRACLCLPLASRTNGDMQYVNKFFEQTLSVELCGTAGLTPPTTPPHKPSEDELFKPDSKTELCPRSSCLARAHMRRLPEQTELYAQLCRMGQAGDADRKNSIQCAYSDHDYCLLGLEGRRKRTVAAPDSVSSHQEKEEKKKTGQNGLMEGQNDMLLNNTPDCQQKTESEEKLQENSSTALSVPSPEQSNESPASSPTLELDAPVSCSPTSPSCQLPFSSESPETCAETSERSSSMTCGPQDDVNKSPVIYIHNLPSSVSQSMLCKRFEAFGLPEDCKVLVKNQECCGVITLRPAQNGQTARHRWGSLSPSAGSGSRRFSRKRYIDLDEAGPGPVKSKYDALDFDALLKEAQRSLHR